MKTVRYIIGFPFAALGILLIGIGFSFRFGLEGTADRINTMTNALKKEYPR